MSNKVRVRGITKAGMVMTLVAMAMFPFAGTALAADGPTPPELGDPVGANVSPHGGYSSATQYCVQCHEVHRAPDPGYALMAKASVTDVCATCHAYLGGATPGFPANPDIPGQAATTSSRGVYTSGVVHPIGAGGTRIWGSNWSYGWRYSGPTGPSTVRPGPGTSSITGGGLYCSSCHTPHGDFGQLINSKWAYTSADQSGGTATGAAQVLPWENGTRIWWENPTSGVWEQRYLWQSGGSWQVCTGSGGAGTCNWAQVKDAEGQLVSLYGYKMLASSPNHQYPFPGTPPKAGEYGDAGQAVGSLNAAATVADLTLSVNVGGNTLPVTATFYIKVDSEIMQVTGAGTPGDPRTFTVVRGAGGTLPAVHSAGAAITRWGGANVGTVKSWNVDRYGHDQAYFCGTCHSTRIDWSFGGTSHNHPTGCESCHGNPADGSSADYPHSSTNPSLLQDVPDALCIQCHTAGSLP